MDIYNKSKINIVIRTLVMSDFLLSFALGILSPIYAVFILDKIPGSTLQVVGLATAMYWIARVLTTIPLSRFMDKTDGERDEYYFLLVGTFIMSTLPLFYLVSSQPWHVYVIQFFMGISGSMLVPAWRILFVDHLDKGKTGYEWSIDDVAIGISTAVSAYVGSLVAQNYGFSAVFFCLFVLGMVSLLIIVPLYKYAEPLSKIKKEKRLGIIKSRRQHAVNFHVKGA